MIIETDVRIKDMGSMFDMEPFHGDNQTTPYKDQVALLWLVGMVEGNVLEIGTYQGKTTAEIAKNYPDKLVYTIDCLSQEDMQPWQRAEFPPIEERGMFARNLSNVILINGNSREFNYNAIIDPMIVFIDGDHSYEGVKQDTERALSGLKRRGSIIVWHDFWPWRDDEASIGVGVKRYLMELSEQYVIERYKFLDMPEEQSNIGFLHL